MEENIWEGFDPNGPDHGLGYESVCACGCGHGHAHMHEDESASAYAHDGAHDYEHAHGHEHERNHEHDHGYDYGSLYQAEPDQPMGYAYEEVCSCGCGHGHAYEDEDYSSYGFGFDDECGCGPDCDCGGDCDCDGDCENIPEPPLAEFDYEHDGVNYHVRRWGTPGEIPLVLLHGFMQTGASWAQVAPRLARHHCLYALDLVGHGASSKPASDAPYAFEAQADAVAAFINDVVAPENAAATPEGALPVKRAHVLGYSMGGRIALDVAIRHADVVYALILESAGLGPADDAERTELEERAQEWADRLHSDGMEAFVDYWEGLPLFQSQQRLSEELRADIRAERVANDADAMARVLLNAGQQTMDSARDNMVALGLLWLPTLYVAGTRDAKYLEIAEQFIREGFDAKPVMAGHNTHLELPAEFCKAVESFLRANELRRF